MEQRFLIKDGNPRLTLLFSGWGGEESLFSCYRPAGSDYMLCWDYRSLDFRPGLLAGYREIKVVAWSLGVWVAGQVLKGTEADITEMTAVNGTLMPADDRYGIPETVFRGTLERMDGTVLQKFRRRMCGSREGLQAFMSHNPSRPVEELKEELANLYSAIRQEPSTGRYGEEEPRWTRAVVSTGDLIFPAANQIAAWDGKVPVDVCEGPHYSEKIFMEVLGSPAGASGADRRGTGL